MKAIPLAIDSVSGLKKQLTRAAVLLALLIPTLGFSSPPDPVQAWAKVQASRDRGVQKTWWSALDDDHLRIYLDAGVDVNMSDGRGWTPLHSAARYNRNPEVLARLLSAGALIDAKDRAGDTPLHWAAAENSNEQVVSSLILAGAKVNARDKFGWLPIHTAAETNSNPEVIATLLNAGAKHKKRAYFVFFRPRFLLKHNSNMSESDKSRTLEMLKNAG